jgi:hypothetical protein
VALFPCFSILEAIIYPFRIDLSSHIYHLHTVVVRYYHQFQSKSFQSVAHRFQISLINFEIRSLWDPNSTSMRLYSHNSLSHLQSTGNGIPCGLILLPYSRPFLPAISIFIQPNKLLVSIHITFSLHLYNRSQTVFKIVHTNNCITFVY